MAELAAASPAGAAASNVKLREPFKFRPELLAPERLAPNIQELLRTRSIATEELASGCLAAVLAAAKIFAASGRSTLPRVGVIGGGAVGCAVLIKLLVHEYPALSLSLSTRQPDRTPKCEALQQPAALALFDQVARFDDNARLARESDVVVLCVPPSQLKGVAMQLRVAMEEKKSAIGAEAAPLIVVSVLCGVTRASVAKASGCRAVVALRARSTTNAASVNRDQEHEDVVAGLAELHGSLLAGDQGERPGMTESWSSIVDSMMELLVGSPSEDLQPCVSRVADGDATEIPDQWPVDWQRALEELLAH